MTDYQNNISGLSKLDEFKYENVFKVYDIDNYYIYNLSNNLDIDTDLEPEFYNIYTVNRPTAWTIISYENYNTIDLWWLICLINGIINPIQFPETGTELKVLKPEYVRLVIDKIRTRINE